jgi:hypothetical protein
MMAVGFDGIAFGIIPDGDGFIPLPASPDNDNQPRSYAIDVRMQDGSDVSDLRAKRCRVTMLPAMAGGGMQVIEDKGLDGTGVATLVYATAGAAELSVNAILVSINPTAFLPTSGEYRVSLRFLIVE